MQIGVTGHQSRPGIDWLWVRHSVQGEIERIGKVSKAISSLASGSDQIFANVASGL